jgi:putative membrane protein
VQEQSAPLPPEAETGLKAHLALVAGFCMGAADSVPGVSGGTIALILGVYERFITSLSRVLKAPMLIRDAAGRRRLGAAFGLLVPLGIGLVIAYYLGTLLLVGPEAHPGWLRRTDTAPLCYAFFFGLVLASLHEPWSRIASFRPVHLLAAVLAAAGAFTFTLLPHTAGEPETWQLLYGGALAVTVMLLPGVSGSLVLVVLGQYTVVAGAVHDRHPVPLLVFLAGIGLGLATAVPLLRHLLRRQHDLTMAALTGLMAGSLGALWPWKANYDPKVGPLTNVAVGDGLAWVLVAAVLGAAAAWGLARLEHTMRPADPRP